MCTNEPDTAEASLFGSDTPALDAERLSVEIDTECCFTWSVNCSSICTDDDAINVFAS